MGHPSLDLTGKVAVVLGGTAGIGRAFSLGMAEAGADVVACARTAETVENARDLRESAEMHRRVFRAIRARDADAARLAMTEHLQQAQHAQTLEARPGETGDEQ